MKLSEFPPTGWHDRQLWTLKRVDIQAARAILDECGVDYGDNDR